MIIYILGNFELVLQFLSKYAPLVVFDLLLIRFSKYRGEEIKQAEQLEYASIASILSIFGLLFIPIEISPPFLFMIIRGLVLGLPILYLGAVLFLIGRDFRTTNSSELFYSGIFWVFYALAELGFGLAFFMFNSLGDPFLNDVYDLIFTTFHSARLAFSMVASTFLIIFAVRHRFTNLTIAGSLYFIGCHVGTGLLVVIDIYFRTGWIA